MPDPSQGANGNVFVSEHGQKALGNGVFEDISKLVDTPVAFVTSKDAYRDPEKLRTDLQIPSTLETSKFSNKGFQDRVETGRPSATPAGNPSGVCAVSLPEKPETIGMTFNRLAHVDPRSGPPNLGVDLNAIDPTAIAHEVAHCSQEPIAKNAPKIAEKILAAEVDADNKAKTVFPAYASVIDDGRALGGQHDAMKGDYDHAVSLYGRSRGKLSAEEISNTYQVLNQRIGKQYVNDPRADPERVNSALHFALDPDNMFDKAPLTPEDGIKLEASRQKIGTLPATQILTDIPEKVREEQGIEQNFYSKAAENMPSDPRLISDLIHKIDPNEMSPNEKTAANIYTDAADRLYPPAASTSQSSEAREATNNSSKGYTSAPSGPSVTR